MPAKQNSGRPFLLDPLFRRVTDLPGVGPRQVKLFEKLCGGERIIDLLSHKPIDFIDRSFTPTIAEAPEGKVATLTVRVGKHTPGPRPGSPHRVWCTDETGTINLTFFRTGAKWIQDKLPVDATVTISGRVEIYNGQKQIVHPEIGAEEDKDAMAGVEPVYPLTAGLTNKAVNKAIRHALKYLPPDMPEWLGKAHQKKQNWPPWQEALAGLHFPLGEECLDPLYQDRTRLAYDELLAGQLALSLVRHKTRHQKGRVFKGNGQLRDKVLADLPFALTGAQERSLKEILSDMEAPLKMLRLLQGDVGSGKTITACLAMLCAVETGAQATLMAPTEILARQHAANLKPFLDAAGVRHVILTGRHKGKERDVILQQIAGGAAQIVIGTHALFQDDVDFHDLGLAVIDEQHRFGVEQRMRLSSKGKATDVLVMTATPIPRTLTLTAYGDMDVSRLDEKPPGRQPVDTRLIPQEKLDEVIGGIARQIETGTRIYWVCPLVEESEVMDLAAAEERYEILQHYFGDQVGLVHGRMKGNEKDDVMARFSAGDLSILIATTVIEVGVDVPEATIMIVEQAERFGLAQLHQLRGRVGRGGEKSYCFLIYKTPLTDSAKERLSVMRETEDGFIIAEKDLELRGAGDILGTKQSGLPGYKFADLAAHGELLAAARDDARLIVGKDPDLETERGQALRTLLYLFEQDAAIRYLRAG